MVRSPKDVVERIIVTAKDRAAKAFAAVEPDLIEISHWMYENPEPAFEEFRSSERLAAFLAETPGPMAPR
jgi:metal-dependent amidase/aminoacylase/carboxypeptidase family protein